MNSTPRLAVYLSSHGYGHTTRAIALLDRLKEHTPLDLFVCGSSPEWLWPQRLAQHVRERRTLATDVGVRQPDDLTVDRDATARELDQWQAAYPAFVQKEAAWLREQAIDLVVGDVPPVAFDAAADAGVRSVAMANFSWDWIYGELGLHAPAQAAAEAYARAEFLVALEPGCPMPAFGRRVEAGVIGRRASDDRHVIRERLGIPMADRLVLVAFKSAGGASPVALPPETFGVRYIVAGGGPERGDVMNEHASADFVDLTSAADLVVTKPGYGIIGDTCAAGTPMLFAVREGFPEDPYLVDWLERHAPCRRTERDRLAAGDWLADAEALLDAERRDPSANGLLDDACREIAALL